MPARFIQFGPWTFHTFAAATAAALLLAAVCALLRLPRAQRAPAANACLLALTLGLAAARLEHVLLQWDYFADHSGEILDMARGGLGWHGAALGGTTGLWLGVRLWLAGHPRAFAQLLRALAPTIPLVMLAAWYGCAPAGCGYGREVATLADYPPLVAAELPDVYGVVAPRLNTPLFGIGLAAALGLRLMWTAYRDQAAARARTSRPFWSMLMLAALAMCVIGTMRTDVVPHAAGLRLDQWLDLATACAAAAGWLASGGTSGE